MNLSGPKILLHLEGLAVLVAATLLYGGMGHPWSWFFLIFLAPDLAFVGYLAGNRIGAACYNAVHTYIAPLLMLAFLTMARQPQHLWVALVWTAHIGFDRFLGYGLKYGSGPKETHLNRV